MSDLAEVRLTGACLEDWSINRTTGLDGVICDYVYLKADQRERRPINGDFSPGEFAVLFQKALETVDLIFADGIDWKAFFLSFQELQAGYGDENLAIQAIEKKGGGAFVIRLEAPPGADKSAIESSAKELYETKLALMEQRYREVLKAKEGEIVAYKEQSANLMEIIKLQASRPITVEATAMAENKASKYDLRNAQFAGGFAETVQGDQIGGAITNQAAESPSLAEAAAEIQNLLKQLETSNPTATETEQTAYLNAMISPTRRQRFIGALQSASSAALDEIPYGPILKALVEGWKNPKG